MKTFLLFILCFFVFSCSTRKKQSDVPYSVIPMANISFESKLKLSEFVESIEAIPLETTPESLIGEIKRIIHRNGRYYMLVTNGYTNGRILVFDDLGKFLLKIDKIGQGEGEYLEISDFALSSKTEIKVSAYTKMITYDSVGNYLRETRMDYYPYEIYSIPDGNYMISHSDFQISNNKALGLMDNMDHISAEFFEIRPNETGKLRYFGRLNRFANSGANYYFGYPLCDTIYTIKDGNVSPAYYIDFGARKIDYSSVEAKDDLMEILNKISGKEYIELTGFQVRPYFLCVEASNNENDSFLAFCFKNGNRIVGGHYIVDDMFFKSNYISLKAKYMPRNMDGDYLLWPLPTSFILNGYEQYKKNLSPTEWELFCGSNRRLTDMCEKLSEEDNPVLLKVKVKK